MTLVIRRNGKVGMSDSERLAAIREQIRTEFGRGSEDLNVYLNELRERILSFERRHKMNSDTMLKALSEGKICETSEVSMWAWTWQTLKRLEKETPLTGTR